MLQMQIEEERKVHEHTQKCQALHEYYQMLHSENIISQNTDCYIEGNTKTARNCKGLDSAL